MDRSLSPSGRGRTARRGLEGGVQGLTTTTLRKEEPRKPITAQEGFKPSLLKRNDQWHAAPTRLEFTRRNVELWASFEFWNNRWRCGELIVRLWGRSRRFCPLEITLKDEVDVLGYQSLGFGFLGAEIYQGIIRKRSNGNRLMCLWMPSSLNICRV